MGLVKGHDEAALAHHLPALSKSKSVVGKAHALQQQRQLARRHHLCQLRHHRGLVGRLGRARPLGEIEVLDGNVLRFYFLVHLIYFRSSSNVLRVYASMIMQLKIVSRISKRFRALSN